MNKLYLAIPLSLLLAFGGFYALHHRAETGRRAVAAEEAARRAAAEAETKAAAERAAREDAERRAAERLAAEQRKEDEKRARWEAEGRRIADDTAGFRAAAAKSSAEIAGLERRLAELRTEKERSAEAAFALAQEVEAARIRKRNAELEIQRLVEMVARRAETTLSPVPAKP